VELVFGGRKNKGKTVSDEIKIREHVDEHFDKLNGLTIESVHVTDDFVLFLLSDDKFTTIEATCDDDEAYVNTYDQHSDLWLTYKGFSVEFLREHRLLTAKAIERIEKDKMDREARKLKEEREEYEKLKAKFEGK
jgi:hypothetical protein